MKNEQEIAMRQTIYSKTLTFVGWVLAAILFLTVMAHAIVTTIYVLLLGGLVGGLIYLYIRTNNASESTEDVQSD